MSRSERKVLLLAALVVLLILACRLGPRLTPTPRAPTPTALSRLQSLPPTATHTSTPTPMPTALSTATPVRVTPFPTPSPTPPVPDAGPLPAYWTELNLALFDPVSAHVQGIYGVFDLATGSSAAQLYALGHCLPSLTTGAQGWGLCLSIVDLDVDRVVESVTVVSPSTPGGGGEGYLVPAGETIYVHQPWAGVLYTLDRRTLDRTGVLTEVYGVAHDAQDGTTYVATAEGLRTLHEHSPIVPLDRSYDTAPLEMVASQGRVYLLGESTLHVYNQSLQRVAQVDLPEGYLTGLLMDSEHSRLYIGGYAGLHVLDTETLRLRDPLAGPARSVVPNVMAMALDQQGAQLFVLIQRQRDWFGGYGAALVDTETWSTRELYTTQSGELRDLAIDRDSSRLLVASASDHSLLPVFYETLEVAPRLPLGIEVGQVIVAPASERLYVSDSAGWVTGFDRRTYDPIFRVYGGRHISLDAKRGTLYAGDPRVPFVTQFDAQSGDAVSRIERAGKPRAGPASGQVVIVNRRFYVHDAESGRPLGDLQPGVGQPPSECPECYYTVGVEAVIDALRGYTATLTYTPWPGKPGPSESIVYDLVSGRAYYSLRTGGYVHFSSISAYSDLAQLEGGDLALRTLEGLSGDLALDASMRRLYVARGDMLFVLDSETLNRQGRVYTEGWTPRVAAVDEELGRLYLPRGSKLEVWSRTGAAPPDPLPPEPLVVTHTVTSLLPSPNYAEDRTLLATIDGWPARSSDGGETWQHMRGGLPDFAGHRPTVALAFSPAFAEDGRLFAGVALGEAHGEGVFCSEDRGDTWLLCSDGLYDLRVYRVQPSPAFAQDRTLLAYAHIPQGDALYRSTNAGKSWRLELRQADPGRPPLPSLGELFYQPEYDPQIECNFQGECRRSDDGGQEWTSVDTSGVSLEGPVEAAFSPQYAQDGTLYILTQSELIRHREGDRRWARCQAEVDGRAIFGGRGFEHQFSDLAVAASSRIAHDLLIGSVAGEFYRIPASDLACTPLSTVERSATPLPTATPTPCAEPVDTRLSQLLLESKDGDQHLRRLGCAVAPAETAGAATEPFEGGSMIWREDLGQIYVLPETGKWVSFPDTWTPEQPEPEVGPPRGLYAPVRGFGKIWREELDGSASSLGWATAPERGTSLLFQQFSNGSLFYSTKDDQAWALFDDGTWALVER